MFCSNCGKQIDDGVAFCSGCGTSLNSQPQPAVQTPTPVYQQPVNQHTSGKPAGKKGKTIGVVLLVIGALALVGFMTNGTLERIASEGIGMSDFFSFAIDAGFIIGGAYLIFKNKKQ